MMSIQNIHPSSHRGQDAAISAVLHAVGSHAHGSSTGIPLQIDEGLVYDVHAATHEQYVMESAVVFMWTTIPYRAEWRYGPLAHKMIAQDSGHLCQNLYLACASVGLGTCAIGAYHQEKMDQILDLDGQDEFTLYVATVGCLSN